MGFISSCPNFWSKIVIRVVNHNKVALTHTHMTSCHGFLSGHGIRETLEEVTTLIRLINLLLNLIHYYFMKYYDNKVIHHQLIFAH